MNEYRVARIWAVQMFIYEENWVEIKIIFQFSSWRFPIIKWRAETVAFGIEKINRMQIIIRSFKLYWCIDFLWK